MLFVSTSIPDKNLNLRVFQESDRGCIRGLEDPLFPPQGGQFCFWPAAFSICHSTCYIMWKFDVCITYDHKH